MTSVRYWVGELECVCVWRGGGGYALTEYVGCVFLLLYGWFTVCVWDKLSCQCWHTASIFWIIYVDSRSDLEIDGFCNEIREEACWTLRCEVNGGLLRLLYTTFHMLRQTFRILSSGWTNRTRHEIASDIKVCVWSSELQVQTVCLNRKTLTGLLNLSISMSWRGLICSVLQMKGGFSSFYILSNHTLRYSLVLSSKWAKSWASTHSSGSMV